MTCSHGSGHQMIANTLKDRYEANDCIVEVFDVFNEFNKIMNMGMEKLYLYSYKGFGKIYQFFYYQTENKQDSPIERRFWLLLKDVVLDIIQDFRPDLILNTYNHRTVPLLKNEYFPEIPIVSVITEFCLPGFWVHPNTDRYYVACDETKAALMRVGTPEDHVVVTGIPVRESFYLPLDRESLMKKYELDPSLTTLIIFAGTYGVLRRLKTICRGIDQIEGLQTIVVCGRNHNLYRSLHAQNYKNIRLMRYVPEIHELFCCGDFMITKPGGTVLSEIAATCMPVILYDPVPGQELENAEIFRNRGAAVIARDPAEVFYQTIHFKNSSEQKKSMQQALKGMYYGRSSDLIVNDTLRMLEKN